jgi:hypothetical protein
MPEPEVVVTPVAEAVTSESAPETTTTEDVAPAVTADPAPADQETIEEPQGAKPSKVVEELKAQRKKRQDAEREAAYWKGRAEAGGKQDAPDAAPVAVDPSKPPTAPKLDQFETYEQYEAAKDKYLVQTAKYEVLAEYQRNEQSKAAATVEQAFQKRIEAAIKEDPSFVDVVRDPTLPLSVSMLPILKESESAPKMLRWLDQNRGEAQRIASLPPLQAAREMGILEAKLSFTPPPPEPPKRVSSAPEPVKTVTPVSAAVVDEDSLPMEEYHKRRTEAQYKVRK